MDPVELLEVEPLEVAAVDAADEPVEPLPLLVDTVAPLDAPVELIDVAPLDAPVELIDVAPLESVDNAAKLPDDALEPRDDPLELLDVPLEPVDDAAEAIDIEDMPVEPVDIDVVPTEPVEGGPAGGAVKQPERANAQKQATIICGYEFMENALEKYPRRP